MAPDNNKGNMLHSVINLGPYVKGLLCSEPKRSRTILGSYFLTFVLRLY